MIKKIKFEKYRKLENLSFEYTPGVNLITGANGTCKTSMLHLLSNSLQAVKSNTTNLSDLQCLKQISSINSSLNPKVETLIEGIKYIRIRRLDTKVFCLV